MFAKEIIPFPAVARKKADCKICQPTVASAENRPIFRFRSGFFAFHGGKICPAVSIQVRTLQAFLIPPCNTVVPVGTKVRITKSEISMRTWRSPMSATSQGAFVVIPEISLYDISTPYNQVFFSINSILFDTCH